MPEELDPYQVLDVGPGADSEEIRRAFHRAVLRCHPDCGGGEDAAAKDLFGRIVSSYRLLRGRLIEQGRDDGQGLPISNQFDPSDFALMSLGWDSRRSGEAPSPGKLEWLPSMAQEKVVEPAVNETRAFVLCWVAAIVLALLAGVAVATVLSGRGGAAGVGVGKGNAATGAGGGASGTGGAGVGGTGGAGAGKGDAGAGAEAVPVGPRAAGPSGPEGGETTHDAARTGAADVGKERADAAAGDGAGADAPGDSTMFASVLAMMGTYIAVFALGLTAIVASRKTSWLLRVIGFRRQHSLPPAPKGHKLTDST